MVHDTRGKCTEVDCAACARFAAYRLGTTGFGAIGTLTDADGRPVLYPPVEIVHDFVLDPAAPLTDPLRGARLVVREEAHPDAGQPMTFERGYIRHNRGAFGRPEGLPDGALLAGLEQQTLPWLDHLEAGDARGRRWIGHLQAIGAPTWMRTLARIARAKLTVSAPKERRARSASRRLRVKDREARIERHRWAVARKAAARAVIAQVLGERDGTMRRRLQHYRRK